jgi:hypothetical protein
MTIRLHPLLCLSVLVFALPLPAQRTLTTVFGATSTASLGRDVAAIGDVDGDGRGDLLVGGSAPYVVQVISSATYATLATAQVSSLTDLIATGDLDLDGKPDFVVCNGSVSAYSSATGGLLWASPVIGTHYSVCAIDDLDGDGRNEVASVVHTNNDDYVMVLRGSDGSQLRVSTVLSFGGSTSKLVSLGDVEGDPHAEIVISHNSEAELWRTSPNVQFLRSLAVPSTQVRSLGVGNVDGDSRLEALVGTGNRVYACSPQTGQVVRSYASTDQSGKFAVVGNLDTDGYDDLALGDTQSRLGFTADPSLIFVSGATGALLSHWSITSQFRAQVLAGVGDVDGDGYGDLLLGDRNASPAGSGLGTWGGWQLVSGRILAAVTVMPTWCTGGPFAPQLGMTRPVLGQNVTLVGIDCPAGSVGAVGIGPRPDISFHLGVPGCNAWFHPDNWSVLHVAAPGPTWTFSLAVPLIPQLAGQQVALQAFYLPTNSPIGIDLTNGLWARIGF